MPDPRAQPQTNWIKKSGLELSNLCCNKPFRWVWSRLTLENHSSSIFHLFINGSHHSLSFPSPYLSSALGHLVSPFSLMFAFQPICCNQCHCILRNYTFWLIEVLPNIIGVNKAGNRVVIYRLLVFFLALFDWSGLILLVLLRTREELLSKQDWHFLSLPIISLDVLEKYWEVIVGSRTTWVERTWLLHCMTLKSVLFW